MEKQNSEPIRVAQVIGKWLGGGVEAVVMNYYRNIDKTKIQFDFICDEDSTDIPYEEIQQLGGKVILVPPYQKAYNYQKELIKIFKENKYKVVHSHINALSIFPLRAAKKAGVPIRIAHSHSTTNKREWKKNLLKAVLRPFSKVYATHYFCCSEHAGRWLFGDKEFDKKNVFLLNNAISLEKFKYNENIRNEKRKELGIKECDLVIGNIGRFVAQKNHTFLIDIFNEIAKKNKNTILLLAGQGPLQMEIKEKVKSLNLEDRVKFLGQRLDVSDLYQAMDVFVFPSLYEGLGMVLIEAQCSALPCIASTEVPSNAKILENVQFVSLNEDVKIWEEHIDALIKNSCINRNNNEYIKKIQESGYDIEQEAKALEIKYKNLIK